MSTGGSKLAKPMACALQQITNRISNYARKSVGIGCRTFSSASNTTLIKQLRERTGDPMKDVKAALLQCDSGDRAEAGFTELRKDGLAAAGQKPGRVAADGRLGVAHRGPKAASVARNDLSQHQVAEAPLSVDSRPRSVAEAAVLDLQAIEGAKIELGHPKLSGQSTVSDAVAEVASLMGENVRLRRGFHISSASGIVAPYLHASAQAGFKDRASLLAVAICRISNPGWHSWVSVSEGRRSWRRCYGNSPDGEEEFWIVEGEVLRIRGIQDRNLLKVIEKGGPPAVNQNLTKKQIAAARLKRVMASRLTQTEKGQDTYWTTYFEKYRNMREEAEKLYWDGKPEIELAAEVVDKNDPFAILGLKRREKPYSPVEIRAAYRTMALKYHPDHNPGKDVAAKFERIWNAYKMLQHKRSWR